MARKVFFSFHYGNDVNRAMVVRNSWVTQGKEEAGFIDKAEFENIKKRGKEAVEKWIDSQLIGTSVTVVLLGSETLQREYVQYEIRKSIEKGNGIIGVKVHDIVDMNTKQTSKLCNLHTIIGVWKESDEKIYFDEIADGIYDYKVQGGYHNLGEWIEQAAKKQER